MFPFHTAGAIAERLSCRQHTKSPTDSSLSNAILPQQEEQCCAGRRGLGGTKTIAKQMKHIQPHFCVLMRQYIKRYVTSCK